MGTFLTKRKKALKKLLEKTTIDQEEFDGLWQKAIALAADMSDSDSEQEELLKSLTCC